MSEVGGIAPQWMTLPRRCKINDKQVPRQLLRKRTETTGTENVTFTGNTTVEASTTALTGKKKKVYDPASLLK